MGGGGGYPAQISKSPNKTIRGDRTKRVVRVGGGEGPRNELMLVEDGGPIGAIIQHGAPFIAIVLEI